MALSNSFTPDWSLWHAHTLRWSCQINGCMGSLCVWLYSCRLRRGTLQCQHARHRTACRCSYSRCLYALIHLCRWYWRLAGKVSKIRICKRWKMSVYNWDLWRLLLTFIDPVTRDGIFVCDHFKFGHVFWIVRAQSPWQLSCNVPRVVPLTYLLFQQLWRQTE